MRPVLGHTTDKGVHLQPTLVKQAMGFLPSGSTVVGSHSHCCYNYSCSKPNMSHPHPPPPPPTPHTHTLVSQVERNQVKFLEEEWSQRRKIPVWKGSYLLVLSWRCLIHYLPVWLFSEIQGSSIQIGYFSTRSHSEPKMGGWGKDYLIEKLSM